MYLQIWGMTMRPTKNIQFKKRYDTSEDGSPRSHRSPRRLAPSMYPSSTVLHHTTHPLLARSRPQPRRYPPPPPELLRCNRRPPHHTTHPSIHLETTAVLSPVPNTNMAATCPQATPDNWDMTHDKQFEAKVFIHRTSYT